MKRLPYTNATYTTTPGPITYLSRLFPSMIFYYKFIRIILNASSQAKRGLYDDIAWCNSSHMVLHSLEEAGVKFSITGVEHIDNLEGPCVIIGNHMSMMETLLLPTIIAPMKKVTYVIKESLLTYPVFKHIIRSREPIAVTRTQPREDLKTVMREGGERLGRDVSIIVFPQTTRSFEFDPQQFSSIGIKLAKKNNIPVVPLALKTDAWENGTIAKDFGKLNPSKTVHIAFSEPINIEGKGTQEHLAVLQFIEKNLQRWENGGADYWK